MQESIKLIEEAKIDANIMEELIVKYKPNVNRIAREYFLIGGDFNDIFQEGLISLYRAILSFDASKNDNFESYANICINRGIQTAIKLANRKKNNPLNDYVSINLQGGIGENMEENAKLILDKKTIKVEENCIDKIEGKNTILKIKELLNEKQYKVLMLFLNGYSYNEIAERTDLNIKQVDNAVQNIKRKLIKNKNELLKRDK